MKTKNKGTTCLWCNKRCHDLDQEYRRGRADREKEILEIIENWRIKTCQKVYDKLGRIWWLEFDEYYQELKSKIKEKK